MHARTNGSNIDVRLVTAKGFRRQGTDRDTAETAVSTERNLLEKMTRCQTQHGWWVDVVGGMKRRDGA